MKTRLLKKYNFVIANGVKQSLVDIVKPVLDPSSDCFVALLLNDIRVILFEKETFSG